jgi:hypothetical protein
LRTLSDGTTGASHLQKLCVIFTVQQNLLMHYRVNDHL